MVVDVEEGIIVDGDMECMLYFVFVGDVGLGVYNGDGGFVRFSGLGNFLLWWLMDVLWVRGLELVLKLGRLVF